MLPCVAPRPIDAAALIVAATSASFSVMRNSTHAKFIVIGMLF